MMLRDPDAIDELYLDKRPDSEADPDPMEALVRFVFDPRSDSAEPPDVDPEEMADKLERSDDSPDTEDALILEVIPDTEDSSVVDLVLTSFSTSGNCRIITLHGKRDTIYFFFCIALSLSLSLCLLVAVVSLISLCIAIYLLCLCLPG